MICAYECVVAESMLAMSDNRENMGSNERPGTQDDFNAGAHRGNWGQLDILGDEFA